MRNFKISIFPIFLFILSFIFIFGTIVPSASADCAIQDLSCGDFFNNPGPPQSSSDPTSSNCFNISDASCGSLNSTPAPVNQTNTGNQTVDSNGCPSSLNAVQG